MKQLLFMLLAVFSSCLLAEDSYELFVKNTYGFDLWPTDTTQYPIVTNWVPSLNLPLPAGSVVWTNASSCSIRFTAFAGNDQVVEVRVHQCDSTESARHKMIAFLSGCPSTQPFVSGTNDWNCIGDKCFVDNPSQSPSICIFYKENVLGTILVDSLEYSALCIARQIEFDITNRFTNAP